MRDTITATQTLTLLVQKKKGGLVIQMFNSSSVCRQICERAPTETCHSGPTTAFPVVFPASKAHQRPEGWFGPVNKRANIVLQRLRLFEDMAQALSEESLPVTLLPTPF